MPAAVLNDSLTFEAGKRISRKVIYESTRVKRIKDIGLLTKQFMAWLAVMTLMVQPVWLSASQCGCGKSVADQPENGCCSHGDGADSCCGSRASCCPAKASAPSNCDCGQNCGCSVSSPIESLPAIPPRQSQQDQSQTLGTVIANSLAIPTLLAGDKNGPRDCSVFLPPRTAQQICAFLSRFIC